MSLFLLHKESTENYKTWNELQLKVIHYCQIVKISNSELDSQEAINQQFQQTRLQITCLLICYIENEIFKAIPNQSSSSLWEIIKKIEQSLFLAVQDSFSSQDNIIDVSIKDMLQKCLTMMQCIECQVKGNGKTLQQLYSLLNTYLDLELLNPSGISVAMIILVCLLSASQKDNVKDQDSINVDLLELEDHQSQLQTIKCASEAQANIVLNKFIQLSKEEQIALQQHIIQEFSSQFYINLKYINSEESNSILGHQATLKGNTIWLFEPPQYSPTSTSRQMMMLYTDQYVQCLKAKEDLFSLNDRLQVVRSTVLDRILQTHNLLQKQQTGQTNKHTPKQQTAQNCLFSNTDTEFYAQMNQLFEGIDSMIIERFLNQQKQQNAQQEYFLKDASDSSIQQQQEEQGKIRVNETGIDVELNILAELQNSKESSPTKQKADNQNNIHPHNQLKLNETSKQINDFKQLKFEKGHFDAYHQKFSSVQHPQKAECQLKIVYEEKKQQQEQVLIKCQLCQKMSNKQQIEVLKCGHQSCFSCLKIYLSYIIRHQKITTSKQIACPANNCNQRIFDLKTVGKIIGTEKEVINMFKGNEQILPKASATISNSQYNFNPTQNTQKIMECEYCHQTSSVDDNLFTFECNHKSCNSCAIKCVRQQYINLENRWGIQDISFEQFACINNVCFHTRECTMPFPVTYNSAKFLLGCDLTEQINDAMAKNFSQDEDSGSQINKLGYTIKGAEYQETETYNAFEQIADKDNEFNSETGQFRIHKGKTHIKIDELVQYKNGKTVKNVIKQQSKQLGQINNNAKKPKAIRKQQQQNQNKKQPFQKQNQKETIVGNVELKQYVKESNGQFNVNEIEFPDLQQLSKYQK